MICPITRAFFVIVFLAFLNPESSKPFLFQSRTSNPEKKDILLKCVPKPEKEEYKRKLLLGTGSSSELEQNDPKERIIPEATHFTYECCANNSYLIFRWGQFERGLPSPSRLFSRVEVNKTGMLCSVSWASDFKTSGYFGRVDVQFNTSSQCVQWILKDVVKEDENNIIATVRDEFTKSGRFRDCTPISLKISKAPPATPEPSPTEPTQDTTSSKPQPSPTASEPSYDATTRKQPSPTAREPSPKTTDKPLAPTTNNKTTENSLKIGLGLSVFGIVVIAIIFGVKCKQQRNGTRRQVNFEEDKDIGSKEDLL